MIHHLKCDFTAKLEERELFIRRISCSLPPFHVLVQTCNRTELYFGDGHAPYPIAHHLCRVVAGLASKIIGETQIHGQVKKAYMNAINGGHMSKGLDHLFQLAFRVAKAVRRDTAISRGTVSYSRGTFEFLSRRFPDLQNRKISLIGVHPLNRQLLDLFYRAGCSKLALVNRSVSRAKALAGSIPCECLSLDFLPRVLADTDIMISATAAPLPVVLPSHMLSGKPVTIIDLAVPRDVHPAVGRVPGVTLFNIETIDRHLDANRNNRRTAYVQAARIIDKKLELLYLSEITMRAIV